MTPILTIVWVWFTVVNQGLNVKRQDIADVKHLKAALFANSSYDKHLRPVKNQSRPITVSRPILFCGETSHNNLGLDMLKKSIRQYRNSLPFYWISNLHIQIMT